VDPRANNVSARMRPLKKWNDFIGNGMECRDSRDIATYSPGKFLHIAEEHSSKPDLSVMIT
jgi:hypothetical protein